MWMLEKSILGTENSKCEDLEEQVCRECEKNIKMPEDGSRVNNAENSRSGSLGMETWELGRWKRWVGLAELLHEECGFGPMMGESSAKRRHRQWRKTKVYCAYQGERRWVAWTSMDSIRGRSVNALRHVAPNLPSMDM